MRFAIFNFKEKLQNIFEIGFQKYEVVVQKTLSDKKFVKIEKFADRPVVIYMSD